MPNLWRFYNRKASRVIIMSGISALGSVAQTWLTQKVNGAKNGDSDGDKDNSSVSGAGSSQQGGAFMQDVTRGRQPQRRWLAIIQMGWYTISGLTLSNSRGLLGGDEQKNIATQKIIIFLFIFNEKQNIQGEWWRWRCFSLFEEKCI